MNKNLLLLLFCFYCSYAIAQYQIGLVPRVSPDKGIFQKIGFTEVEIKYGSPKVKGRKILGKLVPFDKVWRAGANTATTIRFSEKVEIDNQILEKGNYAFFVIPNNEKKGVAIFNKKNKQWGAFKYDEKEDALRVEVDFQTAPFHEELTYNLEVNSDNSLIRLSWDKMTFTIPFKVKTIDIFQSLVKQKANSADQNLRWIIYLQSAEFLLNENKELDIALEWLNKSEKLSNIEGAWNKQFYPKAYILGHLYWTKAKLYAKQKKYSEAIGYSNRLKKITGEYTFYQKENKNEQIDKLILQWKKGKS